MKNLYIAKMLGTAQGIEKMNSSERSMEPSGEFARDYNKMVGIINAAYPSISNIMPPLAEFDRSQPRNLDFSRHRYSEIQAWCTQIYQILLEIPE